MRKYAEIKECESNLDIQDYINNYEKIHKRHLVTICPASSGNSRILLFIFEEDAPTML
jgi:hypothetical protein